MTYRVAVSSSIFNHSLNVHVIKGIVSGIRTIGRDLEVVSIPSVSLAAKDAFSNIDLLIFVGSLTDTRHPLEYLSQQAKKFGTVSVFWSTEDPYERDYIYRADKFDYFVSNDLTSADMLFERNNVFHVPLAGCYRQDFRSLVPMEERIDSVFFCGADYQNRRIFLEDMDSALKKSKTTLQFNLVGAGWEGLSRYAFDPAMSHAQLVDLYSSSLLVLYLHRSMSLANQRLKLVSTTPGPRLFEAALAGTVQLAEFTSYEFEKYFDKNTEIPVFNSGSDACTGAIEISESPETWFDLAAASQYRAVRDHCYEHRVLKLFESIQPYNCPKDLLINMRKMCDLVTSERLAKLGAKSSGPLFLDRGISAFQC